MEVLHPRAAGLDVHKDTVVACVRIMEGGKINREVRSFATTTAALFELGEWLAEHHITHVAMEATGVYWKPVWNILDDGEFELILANAAHIKNVPGRKTDVNDATWIADLCAHGLIRASFVPDRITQEQRSLLRTRKQLVRDRARYVQRLQKVLEEANIKLDSVISDIMGVAGRAILGGLIAGERDPKRLADLAKTPIKATKAQLAAALTGRVRENHVILLRLHLEQIKALEGAIATIDQEVEKKSAPFRQLIDILDSIPGIGPLAASILLSEIGTDMSRFPSHAHLISWAGMCPRNDESAGKRRSTRMRKGAPWLKTVLIQCAWAAIKQKGCYFQAQYRRLKARRGAKKAIGAVAASLLTCAYHMISNGTYYQDLGPDHFEKRQSEGRRIKKLVERFAALGYDVEIKPITA